MENKNIHRRMLVSPESLDPTTSMDKRQQHPTKPTSSLQNPQTPDTKTPSKTFYMLNRLIKPNPHHKTSRNPPPTSKDYNLKAKPLSVSADFGSSRIKHHTTVDPKEVPEEKVVRFASQKAQLSEKKKKKSDDGMKSKDCVEGKHQGISRSMSLSLSGGGRRRSFGGMVEADLPDFLVSNGAKVVSVDMPPFMQIHAVDCARKTHDSLEKFTSKSLALTLKKEFDRVYGPAWHCIVGKSFGSFVTYSVGGFLYFSLDQRLYILLFKTTVQKAD